MGGDHYFWLGASADADPATHAPHEASISVESSPSGEYPLRATWNHRVFHEVLESGEDWFTIREAHYGIDKTNPHSWTEDGIAPAGNTLNELRAELERMLAALDRPVLDDAA